MSSNGQIPTAQVAGLDGALTGLALTVQDENVDVASNVNTIDFQGAGVTAAVGGTGEVVVTIPGGSGGGGSSSGVGVLAEVEATTSATYTTVSTADADVDATNLSVTFTAPASGNVSVQQEAYCNWSQATGGYEWLLRTTAGVLVKAASVVSSHAGTHRFLISHRITGLTPGASYTYRWGHRRIGTSGTGSLFTGGAGGSFGNARMSVQAADGTGASSWATYTPTLTNFTGTINWAHYRIIGKSCRVQVAVTLSAAPTGRMEVSAPIAAASGMPTGNMGPIGTVIGNDVGTARRTGAAFFLGSTIAFGSDNDASFWGISLPHVWASGDTVAFTAEYETV